MNPLSKLGVEATGVMVPEHWKGAVAASEAHAYLVSEGATPGAKGPWST